LPELRRIESAGVFGAMLRAGSFSVLEFAMGDRVPESDPAVAECTPLFRSRNMTSAVDTAVAAGAKIVSEETASSLRTVIMVDPFGHLFGLREADPASTTPHDVFAEQQWRNPHPATDALPAMPSAIQGITCVRMRVADTVAMAKFYADIVGLDPIDPPSIERAMFYMGGACALELLPGGQSHDAPKDRREATDVWVLRVHDYVGLKAHFAVRNVRTINTMEVPGGWLDYCCDPEGHVFGIQQRKPPDAKHSRPPNPEDVVAQALWDAS